MPITKEEYWRVRKEWDGALDVQAPGVSEKEIIARLRKMGYMDVDK